MLNTIKYSFIIPVFNRPDEIYELLESFCNQNFVDDFEFLNPILKKLPRLLFHSLASLQSHLGRCQFLGFEMIA